MVFVGERETHIWEWQWCGSVYELSPVDLNPRSRKLATKSIPTVLESPAENGCQSEAKIGKRKTRTV